MTCERCRPLLRAYADRELGLRDRLAVSLHLRRCAGCSARLGAIRALARGLAALDGLTARPARLGGATMPAGAGRLALDLAVALAIGLAAFLATDAALAPRSATRPSTLVAHADTMAAIRPPSLDLSTQDLRPQSGLW